MINVTVLAEDVYVVDIAGMSVVYSMENDAERWSLSFSEDSGLSRQLSIYMARSGRGTSPAWALKIRATAKSVAPLRD